MKKTFTLLFVLIMAVSAWPSAICQFKMNDDADDNTVIDSVGSYTGTYIDENGAAAVTSGHTTTGHINAALNFDGTNDYITALDSDDFTFVGSAFSVAAWISLGVDGAEEFDIVSKFETNKTEWSFYISGDALYFTFWDNDLGGNRGRKDTANYALYEEAGYLFVVGTYSGTGDVTGLKVYLDGTQVDDANESNGSFTTMSNTSSKLHIGFRYGSENKATGDIDNVMIFNHELTQGQINRLYNDGNGTENVSLAARGSWRYRRRR